MLKKINLNLKRTKNENNINFIIYHKEQIIKELHNNKIQKK